MTGGNHSGVTEFVLLGFTHLQELLFIIFLLIYITTLVGNLGMIVLIRTDPQLHTSMYFFLSHLSFLDICYSSSVTPKLLSGLLTGRNVISFNGCITQFFFCMVFITTDAIFLAIMAYDRYVAIRQPLHYVVVMSHRVRIRLVVGSYTAGGLNALVHTAGLLRLSFCGPNVVNHFYCEIPPLLPLSCSETQLNEVVMVLGNHTPNDEFVLSGFSEHRDVQAVLFMVFSVIYVVTLLGNLAMIVLIRLDSQLHTPMYFFLSSLSFLDVCYSSSITPRLLSDLLASRKVISHSECLAQFYFYAVFATTECYLLAVMAYDRYVAICSPLLYVISMSSRVCAWLVAGSYLAGVLNATIHTGVALRLSFCGSNVINHFYCEGPPLYAISCTDPTINEVVMFVVVGFNLFVTSLTILISYTYILATVLRMPSAASKRKAFSTCASHLAAVTLFYGSAASMYSRPSSRHSQDLDKVASVFYTVVTPMLNPLIYSLRNKEVKDALGRVMERKRSSDR
ncbi:olfactory receptor 1020-like [Aythya fuligula]|uniref:Olfactory receptor 1020-like n=1 Tax=Aythya fuligula TaxID=219594 RepID=A0A6J3D3S0_AYTFU|nr:olfactory receptor 1020-like [Aythya fuligula]